MSEATDSKEENESGVKFGTTDSNNDGKLDGLAFKIFDKGNQPKTEIIEAIQSKDSTESQKTIRLYLWLNHALGIVKDITWKIVLGTSLTSAIVKIIGTYIPGVI